MLVAGKFFQVAIIIVALFAVAFLLRISITFGRKQGNKLMSFTRFLAARSGLSRKRKSREARG